ncbi:hypothetical protein, partial [Actinoplanes utahensis]|uniref:hypothetical protein n=1 Tax=Actinoplanes utahensis TaxID=1869 RepID=UPI0031EC5995
VDPYRLVSSSSSIMWSIVAAETSPARQTEVGTRCMTQVRCARPPGPISVIAIAIAIAIAESPTAAAGEVT